TPTAGEIVIGGRVVNELSPRDRRIVMVFQSYALYPHLSVYENIAFPLEAQKVKKELHKEKVEWAASLLGIGALLDRKPRELSGGERQRVALARAIVREPAVFLLDEPLSNLDAKLRASAREELERFHRRVGTTTIYVTHDQVEAMAMGDRVLVLNKGVVHQLGTPTEVYDNPADTFVATFLGSPPMNLAELSDVIVGFRPEHFRPVSSVNGEAVAFRFKVENIEYLGSEWIVSGTPASGKLGGQKVFSRLNSAQDLSLGGTYDFAVPQRELKSFIFPICSQFVVIVGANILAIALEKTFRGRGFIRFLILLPWVAPIALGAIGWKWILDSIYSVISWVLVALHFYKPFNAPMWLGEPHLAIASVLLVHSWRLMPFSTVILLAGRTAIPKDIPEAAAVDGAGFWRTQFQIIIPMMRPILSVAVLFGLIFTFTDMTVVYILTAGGPFDSTQTLPSLAFAMGIQGSDLAAGAAISLFLVPLLIII